MSSRPTSVSIIAWILIVSGVANAVATVAMLNNPLMTEMMKKSLLPVAVQYAFSAAGLLVMISSGISMLKGLNWARYLYVAWSVVGFVIGLVTSPAKMSFLPGLVFLAVVTFFLFRPKANHFFTQAERSSDA